MENVRSGRNKTECSIIEGEFYNCIWNTKPDFVELRIYVRLPGMPEIGQHQDPISWTISGIRTHDNPRGMEECMVLTQLPEFFTRDIIYLL